ncbi:Spy/CpxP family protein refolding chaperone [Paraburkholderia sp. BL10I2N1]|uniref:Spy/CpxP family protein refolding chaperone n=1 Tax=Paraburkholderia sp. BL10I2N1 TaxID=1938796 RepID=UPI00105C12D8|nr:Spy/CpxP family protein refolding chaperone [Paraburkholderia sp. BL10I2N1]TDN69849.1 LTXXQ motif family protein [Paraburkholderia sp. BL10I2N1]
MKKTLVMLASALAMSGAFAQTPAPASAPEAAPAAAPASGAARYEQRVEQRIAYLHSQLKITPQQETQWKAFADTMRTNGETMAGLYEQRMSNTATKSAVEDMQQYATIAQAHADGMKKLVDAFDPLYSSLSPDQKKLADTTFRHPEHGEQHHHSKGVKKGASEQDDATVKP